MANHVKKKIMDLVVLKGNIWGWMHKDTSHIIPVNIVHGSQEADKMQTSWGKKKSSERC